MSLENKVDLRFLAFAYGSSGNSISNINQI